MSDGVEGVHETMEAGVGGESQLSTYLAGGRLLKMHPFHTTDACEPGRPSCVCMYMDS